MFLVFLTPILCDIKRYADQKRRVSIIVQLSVAFTLIIGDHLELNRNHMNHVQHDSSRDPQPTQLKIGSGLGLQRVYTLVI